MREVRTWLDDTEQFIKLVREQNDPQKETKIQETIEVKSIFFFIIRNEKHSKKNI